MSGNDFIPSIRIRSCNRRGQHTILSSDICYKYYNKNRALTTEEVDGIVSVLPKMNNPYRKMVYILLMLGMRFSELAYLKSEALKKSDDGQYYLDLEGDRPLL